MKTKTTWILIAVVILISVSAAIAVYSRLPQQVASHWNVQGEVDDTMSRFWGTEMFPLTMLGMSLLLMLIPLIDPLRQNIERFRPDYNVFVLVFNLYMFYIYILTLLWNLGFHYNLTFAIIPAMVVLFYLIGGLLGKSKRNWFIGFRTPWTLSSDVVWEKTHKRAGKLFKITALLSLFGLLFPSMFFWFFIVPLLLIVLYLVAYSYILFQQEAGTSNITKP